MGLGLADIDSLIDERVPESESLDYKTDPSLRDNQEQMPQKLASLAAKAISAFANSGGGMLVLGVDEDADGRPIRTNPPGMPAKIGRQRTDERVDRMITAHVIPRPAARVTQLDIPETDRAYLIVEIAPRGSGPHRIAATSDSGLNGRYYYRVGRTSVEADHYQLRQLFAEAIDSGASVRDYLLRRGFGDVYDPAFATREPSSLLTWPGSTKPAYAVAVVTVIPEVLRGEILDTDSELVRKAIDPAGSGLARFGNWHRPTLEGRMLFREGSTRPFLEAYLDVHRTGYIEAAHVNVVREHNGHLYLFAEGLSVILEATLGAASRLYAIASVADRARVELQFCGMEASSLARGSIELGSTGYNTRRVFKIGATFSQSQLIERRTLAFFDHRLAQTYGRDEGVYLNIEGEPQPLMHLG